MQSEAAFVANRQALPFAALRGNDMLYAMQASAQSLDDVLKKSGFITNLEVGSVLDAILKTICTIKSDRRPLFTTARTFDLLYLAAASLNYSLSGSDVPDQISPDKLGLPTRILDMANTAGPGFEKGRPLTDFLKDIAVDLENDLDTAIGAAPD